MLISKRWVGPIALLVTLLCCAFALLARPAGGDVIKGAGASENHVMPDVPGWSTTRAQELAVAASMQDPASDGWPKSTTHVEIGLISGDEFDDARGVSGAHASTSAMLVVILQGTFRSPRSAPGGADPSDGPVLEYAWFGLDPVSGEAMGSYLGHKPLELPLGTAVQVLLNR